MGAQYVHTFTPEEAKEVVNRTVAAAYNFRLPVRQSSKGNNKGRVYWMPDHTVEKYVASMRSGNWRWRDAAPIRVSDGRQMVSDGGHRLMACSVSGINLTAEVWEGEEYRAGLHTDRLKPRTIGQHLLWLGYTDGNRIGTVAREVLARVGSKQTGKSQAYYATRMLQDEQVVEFVSKYHDAVAHFLGMGKAAEMRGLNRTGYASFLWFLHAINEAMPDQFHADYTSEELPPGDPLFMMRSAVLSTYVRTGRRLTKSATVDSLTKAWDQRIVGQTLKQWKPPAWDDVRFPAGFVAPG